MSIPIHICSDILQFNLIVEKNCVRANPAFEGGWTTQRPKTAKSRKRKLEKPKVGERFRKKPKIQKQSKKVANEKKQSYS